MEINISRIDESTWSFEEAGVRFFLLAGTERALLIDSGMETHNAKELAGELTDLPVSLLNTHAGPDHIGSNNEFESFYMHPAEASNYYNSQKRTGTMLPVWGWGRHGPGRQAAAYHHTPRPHAGEHRGAG